MNGSGGDAAGSYAVDTNLTSGTVIGGRSRGLQLGQ